MCTKYKNTTLIILLVCVPVRIAQEYSDDDLQKANSSKLYKTQMPSNWPHEWNQGIIPFVYDYFSANPKSLERIVHRGHEVIRQRACIRFKEHNPIRLAGLVNFTYLYYSYSGVLEECCGTFFNKDIGRRLVLITPKCRNPAEVAHATLHALGITHPKNQRFTKSAVEAVLKPKECMDIAIKAHAGHDHMIHNNIRLTSTSLESHYDY